MANKRLSISWAHYAVNVWKKKMLVVEVTQQFWKAVLARPEIGLQYGVIPHLQLDMGPVLHSAPKIHFLKSIGADFSPPVGVTFSCWNFWIVFHVVEVVLAFRKI